MRIVMCSCPVDEASTLAGLIVEKRLAACVQVVPTISSVYWWEGKVCRDEESLLLCKTDASVVESLTALICEAHSYDVPEVISVAIEEQEGNQDYLRWLRDVCGTSEQEKERG